MNFQKGTVQNSISRCVKLLIALVFAGLSAQAQYVTRREAQRVSQHCFRVTPNEFDRIGAVWFTSKLDLSQPLDLYFNIYMGADNAGADGIAFVMHDDPRGFEAIGDQGGGLGFGDHPSQTINNTFISRSVAVEFDTYSNGDCTPDPVFDHTTVVYNGNVCTPRFSPVRLKPSPPFTSDNVEDNVCYKFRVTWDPVTKTLRLFNDGTLVFSHQDDIVANVFTGQTLVSYGFTGSTGGSKNEQTVCIIGSNSIPVARNDAATTFTNTPVTVDVLANDTDGDGDQLSVTDVVQQPANGTATINTERNRVIYTPRAGFNGQDVLTYRVCDISDDVCYANCSTATVTITVCQLNLSITPVAASCNLANGGAILTASGGSGNYRYQWSNGAQTRNLTNVPPGVYTVTVNDQQTGCSRTGSVTVTAPANCGGITYSIDVEKTDVICHDDDNGKATVKITGDFQTHCETPPAPPSLCSTCTTSITNNPPVITVGPGQQVCLRTSGYSGNISMDGGTLAVCGSIASANVTYSPRGGQIVVLGSAFFGNVNMSVSGSSLVNHGSVVFTSGTSIGGTFINHGSMTFNGHFNLNPLAQFYNTGTASVNGHFNSNASATNSGTLAVQGIFTNNNGSQFRNNCVISVGQQFFVNNNSTFQQAGKLSIGTSLTVNSGGQLLTFPNSEITAQGINGGGNVIGQGNFCSSIKVTNAITNPPQISGPVKVCRSTDTACHCDITQPPCTYLWSTGATTAAVENLAPGTYTVKVSCGSNITTKTVVIQEPPALNLQVNAQQNVRCYQQSNGSIDLMVGGGTAPYTVLWSNGASTEDLSNLAAGSYSVTVTDSKGCVKSDTITITQPDALVAQVTTNGPDATVQVTGGTAPYSYLWSNGFTGPNPTNLTNGTYTVVVTDANGCTTTVQIDMEDGIDKCDRFSASLETDDITCFGAANGSASVQVNDGWAPYTYLWSTGSDSTAIHNLAPGAYSVSIRDRKGCGDTIAFTILEPRQLALTTDATNVSCFGLQNGKIQATVDGGTLPYTYAWNTGATTQQVDNLVPGNYSLTVTDSLGCTLTSDSITISEPAPLAISLADTDVTCKNAANGIVLATVTGGTQPYAYLWSNGATTRDINGLQPGTYRVTVTDSLGCSLSSSDAIITEPEQLAIGLSSTNITCKDASDGSIIASVTGGTPPFTFLWSNGETTKDISGLPPGNYTLAITDSLGCTVTSAPALITEPEQLAINITSTNVTCNGAGNGSITATVSGGTAPYTYLWTNGAATQDISSLQPGTYSVTVTDANGCTVTSEPVTIGQPDVLSVNLVPTEITCNGAGNGIIVSTVSGGTAPFTYVWSNGAITKDITDLQPGSYSVIVTDANGCTVTSPGITITQPEILTVAVADTDVSCNGAGDGSITSTVSGGTAPYAYLWTNGATTQNINGLQPGTYSVTITDAKGCTVTSPSITITQPNVLAVNAAGTDVTCNGAGNGSIATTVSGGTAPYTYLWTNGATTQNISDLQPGTYSVTVTDANGCTITSPAVTITQPNVLEVSAAVTDVSCNGAGNGSIIVTASGGTAPYTYRWNNGATTKDITNLQPGIYTVTVTDAKGCIVTSGPFTIGQPDVLAVATAPTHITCNGAGNGSIIATISGGTAPYTYQWSNGATTKDITNLQPGTYTVTVTDAKSCTITSEPVTITQPNVLNIIPAVTNVTCNEAGNGSILLTVSGGTAPYTYQWNNGATTKDITNLQPGTYTVTVTDAKSCTLPSGPITITQPAALNVVPAPTNITCNGAGNGSITTTVSGGTTPYTYSWSNGATTKDIFNLQPGVYSVTVTDANACTSNPGPVTISQPDVLGVNTVPTQINCNGAGNGNITATVTGGTAPYTYLWTNGATTKDISGLQPGTYSLTVTDAKGCIVTSEPILITQPDILSISILPTPVTCYGASNGSIMATVSGGTAPFTYLWSNGATTKDITNLSPGNYSVTVTDAKACTVTSEAVTINQPDILSVIPAPTNVSCNGAGNGSIIITASGGTTPYTYLWSNGATTKDLTNLQPGTYSVTVRDAKSCTVTSEPVTISQPDVLSVVLAPAQITCYGAANGSIASTVAGGTAPYTYLWTNGATTPTISGLQPGTYGVTVTDAKGCTVTSPGVTITQPDILAVNAAGTEVSCNGAGNGSITSTVSGGVAPYAYLWTNGATTQNISGLQPGTYSVTVTDGNGCTVTSQSVTITQPNALAVTTAGTEVSCNGAGNGSITATVSGGTAPYAYLWTNGATTQNISGLQPGTYSVTVTDAKGCTVTSPGVTITQPNVLAVTTAGTEVSCNGAANGSITSTVSGGTAPYTYLWTNGATTQNISGLQPGTYSVTVTDAKGCTVTSPGVPITQPNVLAVTTAGTEVSCNGAANGSITSTISGGTAPYTYLWTNGATTQNISALQPGTYSVTVTDAKGCTVTSPGVIITQPVALAVTAAGTEVSCNGAGNGSIVATVSGGTAPFTYLWSNGATTKDIANLSPGTYSVTVTDARSCSVTSAPVTIGQPNVLSVIPAPTQISCHGAGNGSIIATISGGTAPYTYLWSNGATTKDIANLQPGTYSVIVTDAKSCTVTSEPVTISQPNVLSVALAPTQITCNGAGNGSIITTVSGGTAPYTYLWSNGAITKDLTNLPPGTYSVTVTDARSCTVASEPVTIGQPNALSVIPVPTQITCNGAGNGSITTTVSGGTAPYTYLWSNGATTKDIINLQPGTYSVTVTDARSCTANAGPFTIGQPDVVAVNTTPTQITCNGAGNGSITSTVTGGTAPYTYLWTNGATTQAISGLQPGTYSVTVTDSKGCTVTSPGVPITQPNVLGVTAAGTDVSCNGAGNGGITATVSGGTTPYAYLWTNGATTQNISGLQPGTYSVTVTDAKGCTATSQSVTITQPNVLAVTAAGTDVTCNGAGNGSIIATVSEGTAPYTYLWTNGATTKDISGLQPGTYSVTVTDAKGCAATSQPVTISQPNILAVSATPTQITCAGATNGSITASATGGTEPFTYLWSNGATTKDLANLAPGTYSVVVTDSKGCTVTSEPVVITPATALSITLSATNSNCYGSATGSVVTTVSGGAEPFTYLWSNGATTKDLTNVQAGDYSVTVTDATGCSGTSETVTITAPAQLSVTTSGTDVTCYGAANGSITTTVTGGTSPYTYLWTNGATTNNINGLQQGNYSITVTDAKGCTATSQPVTINEPASFAVALIPGHASCNLPNGSVTASITGGLAPFTFAWSTGATTQNINNVNAGQYSITVTDAGGCTATGSATVQQQGGSTFTISITQTRTLSCDDATDADITGHVQGGVAPFQYRWNTGATTASLNNIGAGGYELTVTDATGCRSTASFEVQEPGVPCGSSCVLLSFTPTPVSCAGVRDGSIVLNVIGGSGDYTYRWNTGATTKNIAGLQARTYSVTVTDKADASCVRSGSVTVPDVAPMEIDITGDRSTICGTGDALVITAEGSEGEYLWSTGETTQSISVTTPGSYWVRVKRGACSITSMPAIIDRAPDEIQIISSSLSVCPGKTITLTSPFNAGNTWSPGGQTSRSITVGSGGTYTLRIAFEGCYTLEAAVTVTQKTIAECEMKVDPLCDPTPFPEIEITDPCNKFATDLVVHNAQQRYQTYLQSIRQDFREKYIRQCLDVNENFTMQYTDKEHHRTLYYYDQSGNLSRTVPPEGVRLITDAAKLAQIKTDRADDLHTVYTDHTLATTYTYNSLNQLVTQDMPDHQQMNLKLFRSGNIPAGHTITATQFSDSRNGFLIANDGVQSYFYRTSDGGSYWSQNFIASNITLNDIQLVAATTITYAVGDEGVFLKATDFLASSWLLRQLPTNATLYKLNFFSASEGIVFQQDGLIWRTVDGGESENWTSITTLQDILQGTLTDIAFTGLNGIATSMLNGHGYTYTTGDGGATWQAISDFKALDLYGAHMINTQRGVTGGIDGTLYKTGNGGQSWELVQGDQTITFRDLHFFTEQLGLSLDDTGTKLYRTANGGEQWTNSTLPAGTYYSLFAKDPATLYVGGVNGSTPLIRKSVDGGSSWTSPETTGLPAGAVAALLYRTDDDAVAVTGGDVYTLAMDNTLVPPAPKWTLAFDGDVRKISFVDNQQGYALEGNAGLLKTLDGGKTWTSVTASIGTGLTFKNISFTDASNGWVAGLNGDVYKTTDGGASWTASQQIIPLPLTGVAMSGTTAYAAGVNGRIWRSVNSGASWQMVNARTRKNFNTLAMRNATSVMLGGDLGFIYKTTNSGSTWTTVTASPTNNFYSVAINNSGTGYFVGSGAFVAHDGGWGVSGGYSQYAYKSIAVRSGTDVAMAVGEKGSIIFTNGGNYWFQPSPGVRPQPLYDAHLVTDQVGYSVGKAGTVMKTTNAGSTWSPILLSSRQDLHGVHFLDANTGVIVGNGGTILRTTNGGADKFPALASGTTANLRAVHFSANGNLGVAVGYGGTILTSLNRGQSWTVQSSGTTANLNGVYIIDQTTVYAVGDNGTILRGTNNGTQWQKLTDLQGNNWLTANQLPVVSLRDVYFRDYVTGYVVGDNGTALKTSTRGVSWEPGDTQGQAGNILDIASMPGLPTAIVLAGTSTDVKVIDDQADQFGTRFYYDALGRMIVSQNSRQFSKATPAYSYTLYDPIGRVIEVGEIASTTDPANFKGSNGYINQNQFENWVANGARTEITRTWYDRAVFNIPGLEQDNLRTRVASTTYQNIEGVTYDNASHYSYDIHGNLKTLIQDIPALETVAGGQRYKRVDYEYDLIAGNVNQVKYQEGKPDQFFHSYKYDADNRLTSVYTSKDGFIWDRDVTYKYYQHGSLGREELGENNLQGIDYAYTIHGWSKGVNSNTLDPQKDIGKDGTAGSSFAKDEFGYNLGYYNGDFESIAERETEVNQTYSLKALYNGNISSMVSSIGAFVQGGITQVMHYEYDQLNRIRKANAFNLTAGQLTAKNDYAEEYTYDANGNILALKRNAVGAQANAEKTGLDNLTYIYENQLNGYKRNTNKLKAVVDNTTTPADLEDIKPGQQWNANDSEQDNYQYDEIGNLTADSQEGVSKIEWTAYGKIDKVIKADGRIIDFEYDASGNRISKRQVSGTEDITTYYLRDATGNILSTYEKEGVSFKVIEQSIFGRYRLGVRAEVIALQDVAPSSEYLDFLLGLKQYELKNHLDNVLTILNDRKDGSGNAVVVSANDYYPFGMQMPGRTLNKNSHRYGFNGKEKDQNGELGNTTYDYGFRIYNPTIGKFLSVDPLTKNYPSWSPYPFAMNRPIDGNDLDGLESVQTTRTTSASSPLTQQLAADAARNAGANGGSVAPPTVPTGIRYAQDQWGNVAYFSPPVTRVNINPMLPPVTEEEYNNSTPTLIKIPGTITTYHPYKKYLEQYTWEKVAYEATNLAEQEGRIPDLLSLSLKNGTRIQGMYLYRAMGVSEDGKPELPISVIEKIVSRHLGARSEDLKDLYNPDGTVSPGFNRGGMSTSVLPYFIKPIQDKVNAKKIAVFRIKIQVLIQNNLLPVPDKPNHVSVQPISTTTEEEYQNNIKATRDKWELLE